MQPLITLMKRHTIELSSIKVKPVIQGLVTVLTKKYPEKQFSESQVESYIASLWQSHRRSEYANCKKSRLFREGRHALSSSYNHKLLLQSKQEAGLGYSLDYDPVTQLTHDHVDARDGSSLETRTTGEEVSSVSSSQPEPHISNRESSSQPPPAESSPLSDAPESFTDFETTQNMVKLERAIR